MSSTCFHEFGSCQSIIYFLQKCNVGVEEVNVKLKEKPKNTENVAKTRSIAKVCQYFLCKEIIGFPYDPSMLHSNPSLARKINRGPQTNL